MVNREQIELEKKLQENPPKIIGGYKKPGWAIKVLDKIENANLEQEEDGTVTAKAILEAVDQTYYPSFLTIDPNEQGKIVGVYFISENEEAFDLIPLEAAQKFIEKTVEQLLPFKYKTLEKHANDQYQLNWPDFS